jgi:two-component system NtrC family sensor kinase
MAQPEEKSKSRNPWYNWIQHYFKLRSTIYGRVVSIITLVAFVLFVLFNAIFRTVYVNYFNTVLKQNGNNVGAIVEGALYNSMLKNDKSTLHSTLDLINTMPGIEDVNLYDENDNLAYSSFTTEMKYHSNPDCISCHSNLSTMFSRKKLQDH